MRAIELIDSMFDNEKLASGKARVAEAFIGAGMGGSIGAFSNKEDRKKGALIGAGIGAVGAPALDAGTGLYMKADQSLLKKRVAGIKQEAEKEYKDSLKSHTFDKDYRSHDVDVDETIRMQTSDMKHDFVDWKDNVGKSTKARMIHPNRKSSFLSGFDDSIDDRMSEIGYRSARDGKQFAREMSERFTPDKTTPKAYVRAMKKELRSDRSYNKDDSLIGMRTRTKEGRPYDRLREALAQKQVSDTIKKKFIDDIDNTVPGFERNKDVPFSNLRGYKKYQLGSIKARRDLAEMQDEVGMLWMHSGQYHSDSSKYLDKEKLDRDFRKVYKGVRDEVKSETKARSQKNYESAKAEMNDRFKKWDERANSVGGSSYGNSHTSTVFGVNHAEILGRYGVDHNTIKSKRDVDRLRRKLAKQYHPDVNKTPEAAEKMKSINSDMDNLKKSTWYEKLSYYSLGMEKTALNKARALYEAGEMPLTNVYKLLKPQGQAPTTLQEIAEKSSPENAKHIWSKYKTGNKDQLNARINAKANRVAGGVAPKKQMNLDRYIKFENPDTLEKPKPVLDSHRIVNRAGRNNAAVLSAAKREGFLAPHMIKPGGKIWISHSNSPEILSTVNVNPSTGAFIDGKPPLQVNKIDIGHNGRYMRLYPGTLAKKMDVINYGEDLSPMAKKEQRGMIARHEISGELHDLMRSYHGMKKNNLPIVIQSGNGDELYNAGRSLRMGTHQSPNVIQGDINMVRKMSPSAKMIDTVTRSEAQSGISRGLAETPISEKELIEELTGRDATNYYKTPITRREKDNAIRYRNSIGRDDIGAYADSFLKQKPVLKTEY